MISEFRLVVTATFNSSATRDAAYNALKSQMQSYASSHPGEIKRADMTRDDYFIADANATEKVV